MLHSVSGGCPHIFRQSGTTPKGCGRHHSCYQKARDETETIKMRVSPKRNRIPRIHHQQRRSQSRPYQNSSNMGVETTHQQERNPRIHAILQLLSTVCRRIQQDSQTPIRQNIDQERRQMGMGRQGTSGVRRITTDVMLNPSVDILPTGETTLSRNRPFKICLLRHIIPTRRGRKMETDRVSVKEDGTCRIQLRRTRQRTISHSSSTQRMEMIPQRKRTTFQSPNRPQKPNEVYDNKRTDRQTNPMEQSLEWLRLQN